MKSAIITVKDLKEELNQYDDDAEIYFEINDDIEVESVTTNKYGDISVHIDKRLQHTFSGDIHGYCWIELGVHEDE